MKKMIFEFKKPVAAGAVVVNDISRGALRAAPLLATNVVAAFRV